MLLQPIIYTVSICSPKKGRDEKKKKFISKLLVFAMSVSLLSGVSQPALAEAADGQNATISGTLLAADGTALAGKTVTLRERSAKDGGSRYTVTTDAQGKYSDRKSVV